MARDARLTIAAGRLAILGVAIVGAHAARGAGADVSGFVGVWTFQGGSEVEAVCSSLGTVVQQLSGARVSIYPGTKTDLIFDIGCHCALGLDVAGSRATLSEAQSCLVIPKGQQLAGDISALTLDRSSDGVLTLTFSGANAVLGSTATTGCALSSLSGSGTLARTGTGIITCGDPTTAVGVLPYSPSGTIDCPFGAGVEDLRITMHDENQPPCSDASGSRGEGRWVLPDDPKRGLPVCTSLSITTLTFCRVDGASFKSLTTAFAPEQFYAVLKLGSVCPNGAAEVTKTIDNEDNPTGPIVSTDLGDPRPNRVESDPAVGTITRLVFCYFRGAASPDAVMTGFPDLGFPYAVLHAYAGVQPPWVMLKRWIYSNDENSQDGVDGYDSTDAAAQAEFPSVVENPQSNTFFNLARVR
jgi:hypothetical protein